MRIFRSLDDIHGTVKNPVVTVGSYDGVHAGHRRILSELARIAGEEDGEGVVVTFDPHPRTVVHNPGKPIRYLNTVEEKVYLLERAGVDNLFIINFTPGFAALSPEEFARRYLFEGIGAVALITGFNHQFGHNREGGMDYLEKLRDGDGFRFVRIPEFNVDAGKVSSTVIRGLIEKGDMAAAGKLLTVPYLIIGESDGRGHVAAGHDKALPPAGLYPVTVEYGGNIFDDTLDITQTGMLKIKKFPDEGVKVCLQFYGR